MGWEQRNGKRYYYRKTRQGRRVVSEYVGTGEFAELLFSIDQDEYFQRMAAKNDWSEQKEAINQIDVQTRQSALIVQGMVRAHFLLAGYHPHKGQMRKRRNER